jgi:energy-converting hydrogenase Eha subunit H
MLVNFRPVLLLIYQDYDGDKDRLVDALHELSAYLQTVVTTDDSAKRLRRMLGIVSGLAAAADSVRVMPQPFHS